jgi:hypothetical protein
MRHGSLWLFAFRRGPHINSWLQCTPWGFTLRDSMRGGCSASSSLRQVGCPCRVSATLQRHLPDSTLHLSSVLRVRVEPRQHCSGSSVQATSQLLLIACSACTDGSGTSRLHQGLVDCASALRVGTRGALQRLPRHRVVSSCPDADFAAVSMSIIGSLFRTNGATGFAGALSPTSPTVHSRKAEPQRMRYDAQPLGRVSSAHAPLSRQTGGHTCPGICVSAHDSGFTCRDPQP